MEGTADGTDPGARASKSGMDLFSEDLPGPQLPAAVEEYLAREREWHRFLRGTGAVTEQQARVELSRSAESGTRH